MKIILLRHGSTDNNDLKKFTGSQDIGINKKGIEEVTLIASKLDLSDIEAFYSSPMKRCLESINLITKKDVNIIDGIKEADFGSLQGTSYTDLNKDKNYLDWYFGRINPQNSEKSSNFEKRVLKSFDEIIKLNKNVLIMTHGAVIRTIMHNFIDKNIPYFEWEIPNGGGYEILENGKYKIIK